MVSEWGLGTNSLSDFLSTAAPYVDIVKIPTGTARLYRRDVLIAKLERYKAADIKTLVGGQFQEYVLHTQGIDALPRHFDELQNVGFDLVEISENIVPINAEQRSRMIELAHDRDMAVVLEVGSKQKITEPHALLRGAHDHLDAGAELVIVEGQELITNGKVNGELIAALQQSSIFPRLMMEVPTPRVGATTVDIYNVKKTLVCAFGPNVNLGNISPDLVLETETTRLGLGSAGPLSLMTNTKDV